MTPKEIKSLVKTLRAQGITHYKTPEIELDLGPVVPRETKKSASKPSAAEEEEIKHTIVEMKSLLKLNDVDLVDRLFPDHTKQEDGEESAVNNTN